MGQRELSTDEMLDAMSNTIAEGLVSVGGGGEAREQVWPAPKVNLIESVYYGAKYYPKFFLNLVEKLEAKDYPEAEISQLLGHPSKTAQNLWLLQGKKLTQLSKDKLVKYAAKTLRYISEMRKSDLFCREGRNLLLSERELKNKVDKAEFMTSKGQKEEILSKLHTVAWLYTELMFFASHAVGHEFHGPYEVEGNKVIIRDYFNLRVPEVWPFSSDLSFNKIKILEIYDKKLEMGFDLFNRIKSSMTPSNHLQKFCLMANGEQVKNIGRMENLLKEIQKVVDEGREQILEMSKEELIGKVNEASHFLVAKPLADELGIDWHPPEAMYNDISKGEAIDSKFLKEYKKGTKRIPELPREKRVKTFKNLFDPRVFE